MLHFALSLSFVFVTCFRHVVEQLSQVYATTCADKKQSLSP